MSTELIRLGNALDHGNLPLSAAVRMGGTVHTAGILPIDPSTGEVVGETIEEQARIALSNLDTILRGAGSSLDRVGIVRVYLADIVADLDGFNSVYAEFFARHHPARYALGVALAFPSLKVELQAVASSDSQQ
ncbi:RidA family protein [Amycolatopsis endophytica]|uniref:2-iminobutanoate/2-iminopropanoate deaminase n=1 Tax=Amycolatopsis endophytica TaxID=860233 RepID=A0A853B7N0_9PSEU|nr:Rid family hydrolase [Amycolatopsis endophytica]NYI90757.1 2-iminobutanoate/2-iminopropanoate deaminase [Amycolatopsis endophytica]